MNKPEYPGPNGCSMPNINAFRQLAHEKKIFKAFCYIQFFKINV